MIYTKNVIDALHGAIRKYADRYFEITNLRMTPNEFIQAFIKAEHIPPLMQVRDMCGSINASSRLKFTHREGESGHPMRLYVEFFGDPPIIIPDYAEKGLADTCPTPLRQRLAEWAAQRKEEGDKLGDLMDAISVFNTQLKDPKAMAVMVPCLPTLMRSFSRDPKSSTYKKAEAMLKPGNYHIPVLPPEVKQRVQEASAFLMALTLLEPQPSADHPAGTATLNRVYYLERQTRPNLFADLWDGQYKAPASTY
jgi:hypothetical protein